MYYGYVYETVCVPTGKKYIGMHRSKDDKIDEQYLGSGILLKKAIHKYGRENFTCRILEWCETREELSERERFYISSLNAVVGNDFYNINDGGLGGHGEHYVQPVTQKQLDALEAGRHLPASDNLKKKLSAIRTGIEVSEETRQKLRAASTGKKQSAETRAKRSAKMMGNTNNSTHTPEQIERARQASLNRVHIHKGLENRNVKRELLQSYLDDGYELGYYQHVTKRLND